MAIHKKDEIQVLKAQAIKIDDAHMLLVTLQQHAEDNEFGKIDRSKSMYRWFARVLAIDAMKEHIKILNDPAHCMEKYVWPDDKSGYYFCAANSIQCKTIAHWYELKLSKMLDWEIGQKVLKGWHRKTKMSEEGYNPNAAYEIDGYVADNGDVVSLSDREALLAHVGQNLQKINVLKSQAKNIKTTATA